MPATESSELLEREQELSGIASAVAAAIGGDSRVLVFEGPGGIGKSRLLAAARENCRESAMRVLTARGSELEAAFPLGVVRQLLEPLLFTAAPEQRDAWLAGAAALARPLLESSGEGCDEDHFSRLHALYWLCANVAHEQPLALVIDDAHWADEISLGFLGFLIRRLETLPVLVVIGTRPPEESSPPALPALMADAAARVMRLAPLSAAAVEGWVRDALGDEADPAFSRACHRTTHGNPLLMRELIREIMAEGLAPSSRDADRVSELGPRGVATIVLLRLGRLEPEAARLARAAAILGDGASLRETAQLAGLGEIEAANAARALEGAEILEGGSAGLCFVHPIVRAAVLEERPATERSELHRVAAQIREQSGGAPQEIACHLLASEPSGDEWAVEILRAAARQAQGLGDPLTACDYLRRALREPPPAHLRAEVTAELGTAEAATGSADAEGHMRAVVAGEAPPELRAATALELANLLKFSAQPADALAVLREAGGLPLEDAALRERVTVETLGLAFISIGGYEGVREELERLQDTGRDPSTFLDAFTLAALAFLGVCRRTRHGEVAEQARRAFANGFIPADPVRGGQAFVIATVSLIWADQLCFVERLLAAAREEARRRGSAVTAASAASMSAMCAYKRGALLEAEEHVQTALELAGEIVGAQVLSPVIGAYGVLVGLERGADPVELLALLDDPAIRHDMDNLPYSQVLPARGMLRERMGDLQGALEDFLACDRPQPVWGGHNPTMIPWRGRAALVQQRLGDQAEALRLTEEEVALAREYGAPRPLGIALHNAGLVRTGAERLELLGEAVGVLSSSEAAMDLAEALVSHGAALRVAGERDAARDRLRDGLEAAGECGAVRIAELARAELATLGVRPRREAQRGASALTPAERRVADLASEGLTNRDIAQALFVTEKTVETHLGHVYGKLGIRSRRKLPQALREPVPA